MAEASLARSCNCQKCGAAFAAGRRGPLPTTCDICYGRRRRHNPPLPRRERQKKPGSQRHRTGIFGFVPGRIARNCRGCGQALWMTPSQIASGTQFCNRQCQLRYVAQRKPRACCAVCRKVFAIPIRCRGVFCSRQCCFVAKGWLADENASFRQWCHSTDEDRKCDKCGAPFVARACSTRRACWSCVLGPGIRLYAARLLARCKKCGVTVAGVLRRGNVLCDACRESSRRIGRRCHKSGNYRKRCRRYGVPYDSSVKRSAVLARDRYVCQLCGRPTLRRWRLVNGKPHGRNATIDHVTPLSARVKGHTWCNVQCACLRCNVMKGDRAHWPAGRVAGVGGIGIGGVRSRV